MLTNSMNVQMESFLASAVQKIRPRWFSGGTQAVSEVKPADAQLSIETSFVADSPPVERMRQAFKKKGALVWYELLQNAFDYNDYQKGKPTITIVLTDGSRKLLTEFEKPPSAHLVARIEVGNYNQTETHGLTRIQKGLDAFEIANIDHGGSKKTLGQHGWGGTIAAAFLLADEHCGGIAYQSLLKDQTPYTAIGQMTTKSEKQTKPRFTLDLTLETGVERNTTTVTIIKPDRQLVDLLFKIKDEFLYANPKYSEYAFGTPTDIAPRLFSLTGEAKKDERNAVLSDADMDDIFGGRYAFERKGGELSQLTAEILPTTLFSENITPPPVFTGGLRVEGISNNVLAWHFKGFKREFINDHNYRADRSTDSRSLDGFPSHLICMVLAKCTNPEVHYKVLKTVLKKTCFEGEVDGRKFVEWLTPAARDAITIAYDRILAELKLNRQEIVVHEEFDLADMIRENKQKPLRINSSAYLKALVAAGLTPSTAEMTKKRIEFENTFEQLQLDEEMNTNSELRQNLLVWAARWGGKTTFQEDGFTIDLYDFKSRYLPEKILQLGGRTIDVVKQFLSLYDDLFDITLTVHSTTASIEYSFDTSTNARHRTANVQRARLESNGKVGLELKVTILKKADQQMAKNILNRFKMLLNSHTNEDGYIFYSSKSEMKRLRSRRNELASRLKSSLTGKRQFTERTKTEKRKTKDNSLGSAETRSPRNAELGWVEALSGSVEFWRAPIALYRMRFGDIPATGYLIIGADTFSPENYDEKVDIKKGWKPLRRSIRYKEVSAAQPIMLPPGYEPVNYKSAGGRELFFRRMSGTNYWLVETNAPVKKAVIYLKKVDVKRELDEPLPYQSKTEIDPLELRPEWQAILEMLNLKKEMSEAQKFAVIAKTVKRSFTFSARSDIDYSDEYDDELNYLKMTNELRGTCAHMAGSIMTICRLAGISCESQACHLAMLGRASKFNAHAVIKVHLDGKWHLYEPQSGRFLDGKKTAKITKDFKPLIKSFERGKTDLVTMLKFTLPFIPVMAGGGAILNLATHAIETHAPELVTTVTHQTDIVTNLAIHTAQNAIVASHATEVLARTIHDPQLINVANLVVCMIAAFIGGSALNKTVMELQNKKMLTEFIDYLDDQEAVLENQRDARVFEE